MARQLIYILKIEIIKIQGGSQLIWKLLMKNIEMVFDNFFINNIYIILC